MKFLGPRGTLGVGAVTAAGVVGLAKDDWVLGVVAAWIAGVVVAPYIAGDMPVPRVRLFALLAAPPLASAAAFAIPGSVGVLARMAGLALFPIVSVAASSLLLRRGFHLGAIAAAGCSHVVVFMVGVTALVVGLRFVCPPSTCVDDAAITLFAVTLVTSPVLVAGVLELTISSVLWVARQASGSGAGY